MRKLDWVRPALIGVLAAAGTMAVALGAGAVLASSPSPSPSPVGAHEPAGGPPPGRVSQADLTVLARDGSTKEIRVAHGQITALDGSSITISLATGGEDTFAIDSGTVFRDQGKTVSANDFAVGDKVLVNAAKSGDGYTANLVLAAPGPAVDQAPTGNRGAHPRIDRFLGQHPFLRDRILAGGPAGPNPSIAP